MSLDVHTTFASEKISKIRWRSDPFSATNSFLTGSWDNEQNNIKLWSFEEKSDDPDIFPFVIKNYPFTGDVTEIKFLDPDHFVASSSCGSAFLYKSHNTDIGNIKIIEETSWNEIHKFDNGEPSPCTGFALHNNEIVTIGEDGCINLLNAQKKGVIRKIANADSCSLQCVTFLKHNEILTGNLRGLMKMWDLRSSANEPSNTFMFSSDQVAATCVTVHPTQRHMMVAGDEEGSLTVWDLRQNMYPVNLLSAHVESVSEIQFHPDHPEQLFSCSSSGELWHWTTSRSSKRGTMMNFEEADVNPWFSADSAKSKFEVIMLMPKLHKPVNSLDVRGDKVLCGCDNEAVCLINNVNVYH